MANILIIDDDRMIRNALAIQLTQLKHTVMVAETLSDGLDMLPLAPFDIIFLDVHLPDGNGLEAMPAMHQTASGPEVIIITGEGSAMGAELAIRTLAWTEILTLLLDMEATALDDEALELLVAFLQAYVFAVLTCIYLNDAIHPGH